MASSTRMVSMMPPHTTKQSKRLNRDTKQACSPKLYIFTNISKVNIARRTLLATSEERRENRHENTLQYKEYRYLFQTQQNRETDTLYFGQPVWLVVVLRSDGESIEEHQDDDEPVKCHRFHSCTTFPAAETVPPSPLTTNKQTVPLQDQSSAKQTKHMNHTTHK